MKPERPVTGKHTLTGQTVIDMAQTHVWLKPVVMVGEANMQDINGHGVLVRQIDQVYCRRCGKTWDVTDPDPPKCKTGDDWIKEIRKMLYNSEK